MKTTKMLLFIFLMCTLIYSCSETDVGSKAPPAGQEIKLGNVDFQVTGDAAAQPHFEKGLLLLHSFEYDDARAEFLKAQELDPNFAMAYWGEAMTYHHTLWQRQEKEKAVAALAKLAADPDSRKALISTELEKDFFAAVEILYGEGTKYERDVAYRDQMEQLTRKYPDNHEVSAFYAISLLGSARNGRDELLYDKSARIVQGIIKENPGHPGALHYLIHSYDDPEHAHLAEAAADSYAKVAPDAAHALHMPSHIYVALGKWDEVVTSNIASWNASVKRMERKGLDNDARSYHAYSWLHYGFLQRGEVDKATDLMRKMVKYTNEKPTKVARSYLLAMKGAQLVETNTWTGEWADTEVNTEDLNITKRAGNAFLEGMKAYHRKDVKELAAILKKMKDERKVDELRVGEKGFAMCSVGGFASKPPNQMDIDMVHTMEMELEAYLATLKGQKAKAADWFEKATRLDETLNYSFGPPTILKPVHEAYGEWLLEHNQLEAALAMFDKALQRNPRRLLSLSGKKKAAELLKNEPVVAEVTRELEISLEPKERSQIL